MEALNDKTLALAHQKKANKILASRICELDSMIQSPTTKLLEGYTSADVDHKSNTHYNELNQTSGCAMKSIDGNTIETNKIDEDSSSSPEVQQIYTTQSNFPTNLGALVQKTLNNFKEIDKHDK